VMWASSEQSETLFDGCIGDREPARDRAFAVSRLLR
jgi:hypothetical protein